MFHCLEYDLQSSTKHKITFKFRILQKLIHCGKRVCFSWSHSNVTCILDYCNQGMCLFMYMISNLMLVFVKFMRFLPNIYSYYLYRYAIFICHLYISIQINNAQLLLKICITIINTFAQHDVSFLVSSCINKKIFAFQIMLRLL